MLEPEDVFRKFMELANRHDIEGIQSILADDLTYLNPMMGPGQTGKEALRNFQIGLFAAFPDATYAVQRLLSQPGVVMGECTFTGTHTGNFFGIAPTSKIVTVRVVFIFDIKGGKIRQWSSYFDTTAVMRQLGVMK